MRGIQSQIPPALCCGRFWWQSAFGSPGRRDAATLKTPQSRFEGSSPHRLSRLCCRTCRICRRLHPFHRSCRPSLARNIWRGGRQSASLSASGTSAVSKFWIVRRLAVPTKERPASLRPMLLTRLSDGRHYRAAERRLRPDLEISASTAPRPSRRRCRPQARRQRHIREGPRLAELPRRSRPSW